MADAKISFGTPAEVLAFVRECLNTSDVDRLFDAAHEKTDDFWRQRIFADLCEIERSETLENVFLSEDSFPATESEYKLGGHSRRTRHLHVDLIRNGDAWQVKNIWKCR